MKATNKAEWVLGIALVLIAISHWLPLGFHISELLGAFAHFTTLLSVVVVMVATVLRHHVLAVSALISTLVSGALVVPHVLPSNHSGDAGLSVGQFNLWHHNPSPESAIEIIAHRAPDVFTIQELNASWTPFTDSLFAQTHPYTVEVPMEDCCYGIGLFSRYPIASYTVLDLEETPVIIAQLLVQDLTITIISLHTRPPVFPNETVERNAQLKAVAAIAAAETTDLIVLGDFNVVPWDGVFKDFLKTSGLARTYNGFNATYPMDLGVPLIPIDHICYRGSLAPTAMETISIPGSDHCGLVVGFGFEN